MRCRELILAAALGTSAAVADALPMNAVALPNDRGATFADAVVAHAVLHPDGTPGTVPEGSGLADAASCCSVEDLLSISGASPWSAAAAYAGDAPLSAFVIGPATPELQLISEPGAAWLALLGLTALGLSRIRRGSLCSVPLARRRSHEAVGQGDRQRGDQEGDVHERLP